MDAKVAQFEYIVAPNETLFKGMDTRDFCKLI